MSQAAPRGIRRRAWRRAGVALALALLLDLLWVFLRFPAYAVGRVHPVEGAPDFDAPVLILGAGVFADGEPTMVLEGRLKAGLALWRAGKVKWFLVSGDNRTQAYNEPQAMRRWLLRQGVPPELVVADFAGRRTYASLKRARAVFGLRRLVIVTSDFHLPRALFLADRAGLSAWGVPASTEQRPITARLSFWFRESLARHRAVVDGWFPPDVMLGPREPTPEDWLSGRTSP
ncbi:MAG: YdcF family protein [Acidobacteria bacterium]|nr:YdcF family protein [Acidobacteriota bacterium]